MWRISLTDTTMHDESFVWACCDIDLHRYMAKLVSRSRYQRKRAHRNSTSSLECFKACRCRHTRPSRGRHPPLGPVSYHTLRRRIQRPSHPQHSTTRAAARASERASERGQAERHRERGWVGAAGVFVRVEGGGVPRRGEGGRQKG